MTAPNGVKVRGICKGCGFVVEATAPKGRVTWRGKCPGEGCHRSVVAHRVKPGEGDDQAKPATDDTKPTTRRRARKGTYGTDGAAGVGAGAGRPAAAKPEGEHDDAGDDGDDGAGHDGAGDGAGDGTQPPAPRHAEHGGAEHRERVVPVLAIFG